jgi:hypothetical protein
VTKGDAIMFVGKKGVVDYVAHACAAVSKDGTASPSCSVKGMKRAVTVTETEWPFVRRCNACAWPESS